MNKDFNMLENLNGAIDLDIQNLNYAISFLENNNYNDNKTLLQMQKEQAVNYLLLIFNDLRSNYEETRNYIENTIISNKDNVVSVK